MEKPFAPGKRTRAQILEDWPPDFPRPDDSTLWRWLNRAASLGLLLQEGTGRKADPFRYHLPGQEDKWRQNPLYNLWEKTESSRKLLAQQMNLPFDEPPKRRRR